jgi:hypothetical protein
VKFGHFPQLSDLNKCYNMTDLVVDGSGGESWSLPAFHMAGLGSKCVVHHNSGIKEWANEDNSFIVKPNGKIPAEDGMFFGKGSPFNDGNIYDFEESEMIEKIKSAIKSKKVSNNLIRESFPFQKMLDKILEEMWV